MLCHNSIFSYKGSEKPWLSTQCRLNAGRLLRLSHRITIYTPIEFSYILSQLCHKFSFLIWTNRHVKHYVFFPIVRFHEKLFFFSLQKIFICRVVTKIAYVRENTPQNIDSIKSYPTSSSGTTFLPSAILNPEDGWCTVLRQSHPIWATSTSKQAHTDALSAIRQAERFSLPTTKPALKAVLPQRWPATDISVTTTQT